MFGRLASSDPSSEIPDLLCNDLDRIAISTCPLGECTIRKRLSDVLGVWIWGVADALTMQRPLFRVVHAR